MKKVAVLGGSIGSIGAAALMAAVAATGSQVELIPLKHERVALGGKKVKRKSKSQRIRKQWYTVDSPEVKRMSK